MDESAKQELIDKVAERTQGTKDDPLTRGTVEKVVEATLKELGDEQLPDEPDPVPEEEGDDTAVADAEAD